MAESLHILRQGFKNAKRLGYGKGGGPLGKRMCWMQDSSTYFIYDRLNSMLGFLLDFHIFVCFSFPFSFSPTPFSLSLILLFFALLSSSHIFSFLYLFFFMVDFSLLIFFPLSPKLGILFSLTMNDPFYIIVIKVTFLFPYFCLSQHLLMLGF